MEQHRSHYTSREQEKKPQEPMNSRRWDVRGRIIMRCPNTNSGRILEMTSNVTSFREDRLASSFGSNITISSTASSPGFPFKDEIDPATYSFTAALKALQARSGRYGWESSSSSERFSLNSKWNDAEKYICNPLSGEVPMECLSAKTLGRRAFKDISNQINNIPTRTNLPPSHHESKPRNPKLAHTAQENVAPISTQETLRKGREKTTRDVEIQSTTPKLTSRAISSPSSLCTSPSPVSTTSVEQKLLKRSEETLSSSSMVNSTDKVVEVILKEGSQEREEESNKDVEYPEHKTRNPKVLCRREHGGCLSWMSKKNKKDYVPRKRCTFLTCFRGVLTVKKKARQGTEWT